MYILRRIPQSIVTVLGVLIVVFIIVYMSGDPTKLLLPPEASEEVIQQFRREMGLDQPLWKQLLIFLAGAVRGDFGLSFVHAQPAMQVIMERMGASLQLAITAFIIVVAVGIPLGVLAAIYRGSLIDQVVVVFSVLGQGVPLFWLGLMLIFIFSVKLRLLPSGGHEGYKSLILPSVTLASYSLAVVVRVTRSSMLEVLNQEYIRTARAKGLSERVVIVRHALRNASIPVITIIGIQVPALLGGGVITEHVFSYPGMARKATQAILTRDITVVMAFVAVISVVVVVANLLVDLLYGLLDPQMKEQ